MPQSIDFLFDTCYVAAPDSSVTEEEQEEENKPKEKTFKIFCEQKEAAPELGEKELSTLTSRPYTTDVPLVNIIDISSLFLYNIRQCKTVM